jgi:hypothetical protein
MLRLRLPFLFLLIFSPFLSNAREISNTWGSGGVFLGAGQSSQLSETSSLLGGFGYGVQNKIMIGGEAYTYMGGGLRGSFALLNAGFTLDETERNGKKQVFIPYIGIGGGSIDRRNINQTDSGLLLSAGVHYRASTDRHTWGFRASMVKGEGKPMWLFGLTVE